jgi:hypothetical protein
MSVLKALPLSVVLLLICRIPALPHHSFSPVYDENKVVSIKGVVTQFRFVNPHALMYMEVTDASGKVAKWTVEFAGRLNLSNVGWTEQSIKAGERVTVTGNPTHTGSERLYFKKLVRADGSELLPAGPQQLNTLEEERRQRALQRNQNQQDQKK